MVPPRSVGCSLYGTHLGMSASPEDVFDNVGIREGRSNLEQ